MAVVLKQIFKGAMELGDVIRDVVGQVAVLGLTPNILDGIEVGGVTRKPCHGQPRAARPLQAADGRAMGSQTVADQQQGAT